MEEAVEGNLVVVADNKIMREVKRRQCITECRISRIDLFAQVGRFIQRLAIGVPGRQLKPSAAMAQAELQRVVIRFPDRCLLRVASEIGAQRATGPLDHLARYCSEEIALPKRATGWR